jgi:hypothetical protein
MLSSPVTNNVVPWSAGGVADDDGDAEALGLGDADDDGDAEDDGDADDDGVAEALGDAEASGLAGPPPAAVSCRAPDACPVPPEADGDGDAPAAALVVDDFGVAVDDDFAELDGLGEVDEPGDGVTDGVGVTAVDGDSAGRPGPALTPTWTHAFASSVVHSSTCRKRSSAAPSSGWICEALAPGIEMLMYCEPCCWTVMLLMPRPLKRPSRIDIAVFMLVLLGTWPPASTAFNVIDVPPARSRPRPTLNLECQSAG